MEWTFQIHLNNPNSVFLRRVYEMIYVLASDCLLEDHRETRYDDCIISYYNLLFDAPVKYDKLYLFLILYIYSFVICILDLGWVKINLSS